MHVHDCRIDCGDDRIAIKGAKDILVEDCVFGGDEEDRPKAAVGGHGATIGSQPHETSNITSNIRFLGTLARRPEQCHQGPTRWGRITSAT